MLNDDAVIGYTEFIGGYLRKRRFETLAVGE
jgi:hypothetical protein